MLQLKARAPLLGAAIPLWIAWLIVTPATVDNHWDDLWSVSLLILAGITSAAWLQSNALRSLINSREPRELVFTNLVEGAQNPHPYQSADRGELLEALSVAPPMANGARHMALVPSTDGGLGQGEASRIYELAMEAKGAKGA